MLCYADDFVVICRTEAIILAFVKDHDALAYIKIDGARNT
jgi:hypothetical protein